MPRKYIRKPGAIPRGNWTKEALIKAVEQMDKGELSVNEISRRYGIPSRTLRRRYANKNVEKLTLGKHPVLNFENEKRLAMQIQKLEKAGFPVTPLMIRRLAFEFAEKFGLDVPFDKETRMAGPDWLKSFLERNPQHTTGDSEGLPIAREHDLHQDEVDKMFDFLLKAMTENDLVDNAEAIFNIDDTEVQLNNLVGKYINTKCDKSVNSITSRQKALPDPVKPTNISTRKANLVKGFDDTIPEISSSVRRCPGDRTYSKRTSKDSNQDRSDVVNCNKIGLSGECFHSSSEKKSFLDTASTSKIRFLNDNSDIERAKDIPDNLDWKVDINEENLDIQMKFEEEYKPDISQLSYHHNIDDYCPTDDLDVKPSISQIVNVQQNIQMQDETDLFFASMAKIVRKLPEKERALLRLQIGTLVSNAEIAYLSKSD